MNERVAAQGIDRVGPRRTLMRTTLATMMLVAACGSDSGGSANDGTGGTSGAGGDGSGGTSGSGGGDPAFKSRPPCTGAVAQLPQPYLANNAIQDLSAFVVDAHGAVLSALADPTQLKDPLRLSDYSAVVLAVSPDGSVTQLMSGNIGGLVADETSVYASLTLKKHGIVRIPRAGGDAESLYDGDVSSGPLSDGASLIFSGGSSPSSIGDSIYKMAKTGGEPMRIVDRADGRISDLTMDGTDLYWVESGVGAGLHPTVQKLAAGATSPVTFTTLHGQYSPPTMHVAGGRVVYNAVVITENRVDLYTALEGEAPHKVPMGGAPFALGSADAYFGATQGVMRAAAPYDVATPLPGGEGKYPNGIALTSTDVWIGTNGGCLYKLPQ